MKNFYLKIKTPFWLVISGFSTAFPLIFTNLGALQWISILPAALILMRSSENNDIKLRKLYGMGVLFFGAYYSLSFHWFFYMYPLDFAGLSNVASLGVVLMACLGLGAFQAVQSALVFLLFGLFTRNELAKKYQMLKPFLAASLWVIFEWWQTVGWWGVPWARLPIGQIDATLLVRSSSVFGSYFVTFVIVAVNFCLALSIYCNKLQKMCAVAALSVFCINLAMGSAVTLSYRDDGKKITVAAAQGNISSNEKWSSTSKKDIMDIYAELTSNAAKDGAQLVVWPETALPYALFEKDSLVEYVTCLARDNEVTIILSAFTVDQKSGQRYNSMIEVKPDGSFGEAIYSKQKLVPFGEFVPMRELVTFIFPPLADIGMLDEDLLVGEGSVVMKSEVGNIGCGICFDSIYENVIRDSVKNGAELIAIATNDSWFSDSAALEMHNAQARLRAIESGRYVIRSANTGISSVIDPMGNICGELGALERGYVLSEALVMDKVTVYTRIGNLFVYMCAAYIAAIGVFVNLCKVNIKFIKKN